jgi:hypothetical protein
MKLPTNPTLSNTDSCSNVSILMTMFTLISFSIFYIMITGKNANEEAMFRIHIHPDQGFLNKDSDPEKRYK